MSMAKFDQLVALYRAIDFRANSRQGKLSIGDGGQLELLAGMLSADNDEHGLRIIQGNADALRVGEVIELEANDPKISVGIVATDLDDLFVAPKARIREPVRYFVISEKFCNSDVSAQPSHL